MKNMIENEKKNCRMIIMINMRTPSSVVHESEKMNKKKTYKAQQIRERTHNVTQIN